MPESARIWSSEPRELLALTGATVSTQVWQALALALDRAPIVDVLTQKRGQPAYALLPEWLSGYAFLFQTEPDSARARQLVASLPPVPMTLSYPANDSFLRAVADRVALNARDVGLTVRPTPGADGNLRMIRWQLESTNAGAELGRIASSLGLPVTVDPSKPESVYQSERDLLDSNRVLPLVHLPVVYGVAPRVHSGQRGDSFALHLEDLWVDP